MTEWRQRYRGPGMVIYWHWHVEKKSLCVHSRLTSCSASEVAAMIEGVLRSRNSGARCVTAFMCDYLADADLRRENPYGRSSWT
ncbi:Tn3 family transposase [Streptomyces mexicanus]|jgi:TnpA family transposase|uniref:Tn3 family transposase n=1 Tax=Streptomyces mexicanus TaxID=178566 RepID=UPI00367C5C17